MKVLYEQGDIVSNHNNNSLGIVVTDLWVTMMKSDEVEIVEIGEKVFDNVVPRGALEYRGKVNFRRELLDIIEHAILKEEEE